MGFALSNNNEITTAQLAQFARVIQGASGIVVGLDKRALVESRLQKLIQENGWGDLPTFMHRFLAGRDRALLNAVVDALTTNHTYFWREPHQFDTFRRVCLPTLRAELRDASGPLVWCAAASYGQEPWTLAGLVQECAPSLSSRYRVLATDISDKALAVARTGWYPRREAERLPATYRSLWFRSSGDGYIVSPMLKRDVCFRNINLIEPYYPKPASLRVIFCRNVLIYFDQDTRCKVYERMRSTLKPGGWLFISQTEAMPAGCKGWRRVAPGMFQRSA